MCDSENAFFATHHSLCIKDMPRRAEGDERRTPVMRAYLTFFMLLLCVYLPLDADASTNEPHVIREIVHAKYDPLNPAHVSAHTSVIGEEEIRASGARNAAEIVSSVVGVTIAKYGGASQASVVSIRGASPEHVLVLVNGKRMNSAQGGGVDLSTIRPESIAYVEVVRGGGSAVYGEGAIGGVVNIVTKEGYGKRQEANVSYGFGSYMTHTLHGDIAFAFGERKAFDAFFSLGGMYTEGSFSFHDTFSEIGVTRRTNAGGLFGDLSCKVGWDISRAKGMRLAFSLQAHRDKKGVPGLKEFPSHAAEMEDENFLALLSYRFTKNPIAEVTSDVFFRFQRRHYYDPLFFLGTLDDAHTNRAVGWDVSLRRIDAFDHVTHRTTLGYTLRLDGLRSTALTTESGLIGEKAVRRIAQSAYLRSELLLLHAPSTKHFRLTLFPSLRFDGTAFSGSENAQWRGAFSYALGILFAFDPERCFIVKGNIASVYRLPSFDDLFWSATSFAVGNADLLPEEGFVLDAGILVTPFSFLTLEATYFLHIVTNLIQWTTGPQGRWRPINVGRARLTGAEAEVQALVPLTALDAYLGMKANYTLLYATDMREGESTYGAQLPRRPYERLNASLSLSHADGHSLRVEGRYVGFRFITAQNTKYLPAYFVLDATVIVRVFDRLDLTLSVKNVLDAEYVDVREYPVPGREITGSASYRF